MISVRNVTKRYGKKTVVDDVSFSVNSGQVTYLLGPNGAGKSTVMRMIAGYVRPLSGEIWLNDVRIDDVRNSMGRIGFGLGASAFNPQHTAAQHLRWQARLGGVEWSNAKTALDRVGLGDVGSQKVGEFSYGMLQRLSIASALLGDPPAIVLDEPANGLDVEGIIWLRNLITTLKAGGTSFLIASHTLAEVEITADRIVILGQGRVLADDTRDVLIAQGIGPRPLEDVYLTLTQERVEYSAANVDKVESV